jgi:hypothetical protein
MAVISPMFHFFLFSSHSTHRSQGNRGCSKPDQPSIAGMRLVDSIGILLAELVHNTGYSVVVLCIQGMPDEALELECSALALVVELIVQRLGDVGVHGEGACAGRLHVNAAGPWHTRARVQAKECGWTRFTCSLFAVCWLLLLVPVVPLRTRGRTS